MKSKNRLRYAPLQLACASTEEGGAVREQVLQRVGSGCARQSSEAPIRPVFDLTYAQPSQSSGTSSFCGDSSS